MPDEHISESNEFPARRVTAAILGIAGLAALCAAGVWLAYPAVRAPSIAPPTLFAAPRLETTPVADYRAFEMHQNARLAGAGGRMPIDRAMAAIVRAGTLEAETGP